MLTGNQGTGGEDSGWKSKSGVRVQTPLVGTKLISHKALKMTSSAAHWRCAFETTTWNCRHVPPGEGIPML